MAHDDPELTAMAQVLKSLEALDDIAARERVLKWVTTRLNMKVEPTKERKESSAPLREEGSNERPAVREGTINMVAGKLGGDSCRQLILAAAVYLTLYVGKERFSREELVSCAREARLWKSNYINQIFVNLGRMCDADELIEKSANIYVLGPAILSEMEEKLAA